MVVRVQLSIPLRHCIMPTCIRELLESRFELQRITNTRNNLLNDLGRFWCEKGRFWANEGCPTDTEGQFLIYWVLRARDGNSRQTGTRGC